MSSVSKISWIGLGQMGLPMARNLVQNGCDVAGYDINPVRQQMAASVGIKAAASVADAVAQADIVFTMLFDGEILKDVLTGTGGILENVKEGSLLIDMSTISPQVSSELAETIAAKGCRYLRAPVSGSALLAEKAGISVFASGDKKEFDLIQPVLKGMSVSQDYVGEGEAARVVKLAINMLVGSSTAALGEAIRFGEAWNMPRGILIDAINSSIVGSRHYQSRAAALKSREYGNAGPVVAIYKDIGMVMSDSHNKGYELPIHNYVYDISSQLMVEGQADVELTILAEFPRNLSADDSTVANSERDVRDIITADDARYSAMLAGDVAGVSALLSPALAYTHTKGFCQNKAEYVGSFAEGQFVYKKFVREAGDVSVNGNLALMEGIICIDVEIAGELRHLRNRYQAVWERGNDRHWRLRAWMGLPAGDSL